MSPRNSTGAGRADSGCPLGRSEGAGARVLRIGQGDARLPPSEQLLQYMKPMLTSSHTLRWSRENSSVCRESGSALSTAYGLDCTVMSPSRANVLTPRAMRRTMGRGRVSGRREPFRGGRACLHPRKCVISDARSHLNSGTSKTTRRAPFVTPAAPSGPGCSPRTCHEVQPHEMRWRDECSAPQWASEVETTSELSRPMDRSDRTRLAT
eukprot:scaffold1500_cov100-Isochrysis_galbana.AAC.4